MHFRTIEVIDFCLQAYACIHKSIGLFPGLKKCPLDTCTAMGSSPLSTKTKRPPIRVVFVLVDDIGLEPMTFRTSSGCSSQLS